MFRALENGAKGYLLKDCSTADLLGANSAQFIPAVCTSPRTPGRGWPSVSPGCGGPSKPQAFSRAGANKGWEPRERRNPISAIAHASIIAASELSPYHAGKSVVK